MSEDLSDEVARIIQRLLETGADARAIAHALLTSRAVASLKADAWDVGFNSGHKYAQSTLINHRRRGGSSAANRRKKS